MVAHRHIRTRSIIEEEPREGLPFLDRGNRNCHFQTATDVQDETLSKPFLIEV